VPASTSAGRDFLSKVPEVTVWFWAAKIVSTAMGESVSDYLVHRFSPYLAVGLGFVVFCVALVAQLSARRYITWLYWATVAMVAIFGTMVADSLHVALHVPYPVSASLFLVATAVVLTAWYMTEGTLSIHSITTPRRELFYWATVCATFALGTATGDLSATTFHLGYLTSALLFTALIVVPLAAWRLGLNAIASFWFAYILTRPVGASFSDYLGFPHSVGGVGFGHGPVALVTGAVFVALVTYMGATRKDLPAAASAGEVSYAQRAG
jgi:uncharacterized membrane-anchored protein